MSRFLGFRVELRLVDVHPPSPERPSRCNLRRSRAGNNGGRSSERWVDATALSQHCSLLGALKRECHDSTRAGCPFLCNVFAATQGCCAHSCVQYSCWSQYSGHAREEVAARPPTFSRRRVPSGKSHLKVATCLEHCFVYSRLTRLESVGWSLTLALPCGQTRRLKRAKRKRARREIRWLSKYAVLCPN